MARIQPHDSHTTLWLRRGANFPEYIGYVHATQAFMAVSAGGTLLSLVLFGLISIGKPATRWVRRCVRLGLGGWLTTWGREDQLTQPHLQARSDTLNSGFFALVFSAVCLVLSMVAWMVCPVVFPLAIFCPSLTTVSQTNTQGVPLSAFTTECQPSPFAHWNGTAIGLPPPPQDEGHQGVVCIQLDGGLCLDNCATTNTVIRTGGMYGLVLFSALAQFVCVLFWVHLHDELLTAHDYVGGRRGSTVEAGAGPVLHPALVGPPYS